MRHLAISLTLVTGALAVTGVAGSAAAPTVTVAATSVTAAPPINPFVRTIGISADGTVVAGVANLDPAKPYTIFDRRTGTHVNETAFELLTADGRHLVLPTGVREVGGVEVPLPSLPGGTVADGIVGASADGSVVVTNTFNNGTLLTTAYVSRPGGTITDLNAGLPSANLNRGARDAAMSTGGRYASFVHVDFTAGCTVTPAADCVFEVYRRDLTDGSVVPVSRKPGGGESNGFERFTSISADGRFVAFISDATDLVPGAVTTRLRLYRHDVVANETVLVTDGLDTANPFFVYSMSDDGSRFAYTQSSGVGGALEVRVADLATGSDVPLVRQDAGGPSCTTAPLMSRNGAVVLFRNCGGAIVEPTGAPEPVELGLATLSSPFNEVRYTGVNPTRLYDSRDGDTDTRPNLAAGARVEVAVGGRAGVAADATAAVLNITVTNAAGAGFVTVWRCDQERPTASNLNYTAGQTIPNAVIAGLAPNGTVCLYTHNAADLIVDVAGAFGATSSYGSDVPQRILDTRADENPLTPPTLAAGSITVLDVLAAAGLPDSTSAVTLNVTVTDPTGPGFVTVFPCDADVPTTSNLNYGAGQTIPNAVISRVAADGTVCLYTHNAADLIVDVNGFFTAGSGFTGLTPSRLLDSRDGQVDVVPNLTAGSTTKLPVTGRGGVPDGATTAVLNVTVTNPATAGFVTVYPCDGELPTASNLNYVAGQTIPNLVVSKLSADGSVCLFTKGPSDLIVDVSGYITA